jgi:hypothetical protein
MNTELFNAILQEDMGEIASIMIRPSRDFTGGSYPYKVDLEKGAVYYNGYNFLVRTDVWMNNILEIDEFSMWVNRVLYILEKESDNDLWDYEVCEYLESLGIDVDDRKGYMCGSGYTYNDSDSCYLDRDIHYTIFSHDGDGYVVFKVHYGADARAGFGELVCFKVRDMDYFYDSMMVTAYDSVANEDIDINEVDEIAIYDKDSDSWFHKETGNEIYINSSADGY